VWNPYTATVPTFLDSYSVVLEVLVAPPTNSNFEKLFL